MIKFFRKIRQRLLTENKISKYLIYAIGEIVLVVIGILIALQINNWNEDKKVKLKSQIYCEKIINDLIADTLNISSLIKRCNSYEKQAENYLSYFNKGDIPIDKLIDSSRNVNIPYLRYFPVNHTYVDMLSSGNSNLLNENQKSALIDLSSNQEFIQIVIEKIIVRTNYQYNERNNFLGYPDDFFSKVNTEVSKENRIQWLLHQHLIIDSKHELYNYIKRDGQEINTKSKKVISLLKNGIDYE